MLMPVASAQSGNPDFSEGTANAVAAHPLTVPVTSSAADSGSSSSRPVSVHAAGSVFSHLTPHQQVALPLYQQQLLLMQNAQQYSSQEQHLSHKQQTIVPHNTHTTSTTADGMAVYGIPFLSGSNGPTTSGMPPQLQNMYLAAAAAQAALQAQQSGQVQTGLIPFPFAVDPSMGASQTLGFSPTAEIAINTSRDASALISSSRRHTASTTQNIPPSKDQIQRRMDSMDHHKPPTMISMGPPEPNQSGPSSARIFGPSASYREHNGTAVPTQSPQSTQLKASVERENSVRAKRSFEVMVAAAVVSDTVNTVLRLIINQPLSCKHFIFPCS